MGSKKRTSESEGESKSKKATKRKRPAVIEETFEETLKRDRKRCVEAVAISKAHEAEMKKIKIQIFKKRCEFLGYSFAPSEEKLVDFYLRSKNSGQEIENCPIEEVDVYANHPKYLIENTLHTLGKVGYFFTRRRSDEIQSSSDNLQGRWIFTNKGDVISKGKKVGVKQIFEFWEGDHCTEYKITEYQLDPAPVQQAWFVCKLDESCVLVPNQA